MFPVNDVELIRHGKSAVSGSLTIIRLNEVGWRCFIVENKTAKYIGKKYGKPGNI